MKIYLTPSARLAARDALLREIKMAESRNSDPRRICLNHDSRVHQYQKVEVWGSPFYKCAHCPTMRTMDGRSYV